MAAGLRNWRGEVIGANDTNEDAATTTIATSSPSPAIPLPRAAEGGETSRDAVSDINEERRQDGASTSTRRTASTESKERAVVFRKDEFGRDIPVEVSASDKDKSRKKSSKKKSSDKKSKKKHKHKRSSRSRSRSLSTPRGMLVGTPPPPDPYRPQEFQYIYWMKRAINAAGTARGDAAVEAEARVDQEDAKTEAVDAHAPKQESRAKPRQPETTTKKSIEERHETKPKSEPLTNIWTHDAFEDRSPSPVREADPFYRPEPEAWVSRAGGVYMPKKQ
uniref:Uncharacterized protein n=1 Tax=Globisporangium ultimum (strain ATCC 200006 / CBS 805.95 / DAOM BR144) TaxID=431595 RepID=K3X4C4_GLOUD